MQQLKIKTRMNWDLLKQNACPVCGSRLKKIGNAMMCSKKNVCNFFIGLPKFYSLTQEIKRENIHRDNQEYLNNM